MIVITACEMILKYIIMVYNTIEYCCYLRRKQSIAREKAANPAHPTTPAVTPAMMGNAKTQEATSSTQSVQPIMDSDQFNYKAISLLQSLT